MAMNAWQNWKYKTVLKLSLEGKRTSGRARTCTHSSCACSTIFENFKLHNSMEEHTDTHTHTHSPSIHTSSFELKTWICMLTYLEYSIAKVIITEFNVQCSVFGVRWRSFYCRISLSHYFVIFIMNFCRCLRFDRSMQYSSLILSTAFSDQLVAFASFLHLLSLPIHSCHYFPSYSWKLARVVQKSIQEGHRLYFHRFSIIRCNRLRANRFQFQWMFEIHSFLLQIDTYHSGNVNELSSNDVLRSCIGVCDGCCLVFSVRYVVLKLKFHFDCSSQVEPHSLRTDGWEIKWWP